MQEERENGHVGKESSALNLGAPPPCGSPSLPAKENSVTEKKENGSDHGYIRDRLGFFLSSIKSNKYQYTSVQVLAKGSPI